MPMAVVAVEQYLPKAQRVIHANLLKGYRWRIIEDVGYDELADKYIVPTGRGLASTPVGRMVYAEKVWVYLPTQASRRSDSRPGSV